MARKFVTPIDLSKLELLQAALQNLAAAPSSPAVGQMYWDTVLGAPRWWTGAAWVNPATDTLLLQGQNGAYYLARANHTGTQLAATISDFNTAVRLNRLDQMAAPTAAVAMNAQKITGLADPTGAQDAATKLYVDALSAGRDWKDSVRAATTVNGTLATAYANGQVIDGVTLATNDRILLKNQTAGAENGIYTVNAAGAPTRATDFDTSAEASPGATVSVEEGTTLADTRWVLTTNAPIVLATTSLTFTEDAGETINAGAGLTKTSNVLAVGAGTGITVNADDVAIDIAVVVRKLSFNCAAATSTTVTHNFNTRDVTCQVYRNAAPYDQVECDVEHDTVNSCIVRFAVAPAAGDYRIVVHG